GSGPSRSVPAGPPAFGRCFGVGRRGRLADTPRGRALTRFVHPVLLSSGGYGKTNALGGVGRGCVAGPSGRRGGTRPGRRRQGGRSRSRPPARAPRVRPARRRPSPACGPG